MDEDLKKVMSDFGRALKLIDDYDHGRLKSEKLTKEDKFRIDYAGACEAIERLGEELGASELFGNEKDDLFKGALDEIYQSFDDKPLYPSVEEKAANLLYYVVKNHSFSDGNKRIGALLFVWFLAKNGILYGADGEKRFENNALVAIVMLIAQSKTDQKEAIVDLVVRLIDGENM
jgi:prophage maintenance system killer protein